jgi:dTDP-4-dehydrorhamnose reductase
MIALVGSSGYIGTFFQEFFTANNIPYHCLKGSSMLDYKSALKKLTEINPRFLINCAGYTGKPNVDACEHNKEECLLANVLLPTRIRELCHKLDLAWGHLSSGCLFTDNIEVNPSGFKESDLPNFSFVQHNCSFYSGSKILGEEALGYRIQKTPEGQLWATDTPDEKLYIWRIRMPFDHMDSPRNYLSKLMRYERLLEARNSLSQIRESVAACWSCVERGVPYGIYHLTNPGYITTREVVQLIRSSVQGRKLEASGKTYSFFQNEAEFLKTAAQAPRSHCVLSTAKLQSIGIHLPPVTESIEKALWNWRAASPAV